MKIIDLSQPVRAGMPVYPGDEPVALRPEKTLTADGYCAFTLHTGLHAGTHVDMPMHLLPDQKTAEDFPLSSFIGPGVLLDVRGENRIGYRPAYDALIPRGAVVLLFTGFSGYFTQPLKYFGEHPVVEENFAAFLAGRGIRMLGMDMPSPDLPPFPVHRLLLKSGVFILENLTGLASLIGCGAFEAEAVPLKLRAEASPVRAFARAYTDAEEQQGQPRR